jgi:seryl-tRNA synthetase
MLDPKRVLDDPEGARAALSRRGPGAVTELDEFLLRERGRRELIHVVEERRAERNRANQAMKTADKQGPDFAATRERLRELSESIRKDEQRLGEIERERDELLLRIPNWPADSVPDGVDTSANVEVARSGEPPAFSFEPRAHWEIGETLGILDFERAAKVSGARFAVLWGKGARLERALIQFMLDLHVREHGYREVWTPFLVKPEAMVGTGQLPKFGADAFRTEGGDYYLVPTAEVPVTNLHRDEILDGASLPRRYVAYTPCFRAEAGSHGQDVRGLIRQHQFDKVELVKMTRPETSEQELLSLRADAEAVLRRLGLCYRVVELCAGDLGFSALRCFDLEVWLPGQGSYREISSCSSFGDYQARRARIRMKDGPDGKPRLVHTINGSALAVGRTMVALLEQHQQRDGSVLIPEPLRPYMDGAERLEPP